MLRSFRRSPVSLPDALSATIWVGRRFFQRRKMRQVPIWTGDIVEVEYCTVEDYYPNYRILKQKLMTEFADLIEVRGNPYGMPRRSAFEVLWRRGEDLQEELWSKYSSGEPSTEDETHGVAEVIVYDLQQILKKYGLHRGRYKERYPATIDEMDFYRDLDEENSRLLKAKDQKSTSFTRKVTFKRRRRV